MPPLNYHLEDVFIQLNVLQPFAKGSTPLPDFRGNFPSMDGGHKRSALTSNSLPFLWILTVEQGTMLYKLQMAEVFMEKDGFVILAWIPSCR